MGSSKSRPLDRPLPTDESTPLLRVPTPTYITRNFSRSTIAAPSPNSQPPVSPPPTGRITIRRPVRYGGISRNSRPYGNRTLNFNTVRRTRYGRPSSYYNNGSTQFTNAAAKAAMVAQERTRPTVQSSTLPNTNRRFKPEEYRERQASGVSDAAYQPIPPRKFTEYTVEGVINNNNQGGGVKRTGSRKSKKRIVCPLKKSLSLSRSTR
jgi:hypothetical protein